MNDAGRKFTSLLRCRISLTPWRYEDGDVHESRCSTWSSSYRAGDDTDVLGILLEPVVHVLTHGEQVVEAGSLSRGPVALRHLQTGERRRAGRERQPGGDAEERGRQQQLWGWVIWWRRGNFWEAILFTMSQRPLLPDGGGPRSRGLLESHQKQSRLCVLPEEIQTRLETNYC